MWPVILRELREQARQSAGVGLRIFGAATAMLVILFQWQSHALDRARDGRLLFGSLNVFLLISLWLAAPVMSADCLSREKREGTIGLLFLTPLTALDIVVGKAFVYAWRILTVVIAAIPMLMVPVMIGGVGWLDGVRMVVVQIAVVFLALSAGLLASSLSIRWLRARVLAFTLATASAVSFVLIYATAQTCWIWTHRGIWRGKITFLELWGWNFQGWLSRLGLSGYRPDGYFRQGAGGGTNAVSVLIACGVLGATVILVVLVIRVAAMGLKRTWQAEPPSQRTARAVSELTRVRAPGTWWRRRSAQLLDRNPAAWLHSMSWVHRIGTSGWLGLTLIWFVHVATDGFYGDGGQSFIRYFLLIGMAFIAASSFRGEREAGGLELLLVTQLQPRQLVLGRLSAILKQFLPAVILVVLMQFVVTGPMIGGLGFRGGNVNPVELELARAFEFVTWMTAMATVGVALATMRMPFLAAFGITVGIDIGAAGISFALGKLVEASGGFPEEVPMALQLAISIGLAIAGGVAGFRYAIRGLQERWFLPVPKGRSGAEA